MMLGSIDACMQGGTTVIASMKRNEPSREGLGMCSPIIFKNCILDQYGQQNGRHTLSKCKMASTMGYAQTSQ